MDFAQFEKYSEKYNVIPLSKVMLADTLTPVSAYLRLRQGTEASFLFESVEGGERVARYSFIGRNPRQILSCTGTETVVTGRGASRRSGNFFDVIEEIVSRFHMPEIPGLPRFTGGLVGFIGYDAVRFIEKIPDGSSHKLPIPDSLLGLFGSVVVFDHLKHQTILIVNALTDSGDLREVYRETTEELLNLERILFSGDSTVKQFRADMDGLQPEISRERFVANVAKAKNYIREGDIFQVVLSQRFSADMQGDPFNVYRALRVINPSPYLYFLDFGGLQVIGSSPEILVRVEGEIGEIYPIAGTRPRGKDAAEDAALEKDLLADEKERAEHIMLVDLGRNDLGRVCDTVRVEALMTIVRYSHVMHIASKVSGTLSRGKTGVDVLKAAFPAGTVSGAPKIRAMEIIDELENSRRGIYAGGVGYFDFSGSVDMCIAIRTLFAAGGKIYFQAGAGIVADSDPEKEFTETMNKAGALIDALSMASELG